MKLNEPLLDRKATQKTASLNSSNLSKSKKT